MSVCHFQIGLCTTSEIIDAQDALTLFQQNIAQLTANETGRACNNSIMIALLHNAYLLSLYGGQRLLDAVCKIS